MNFVFGFLLGLIVTWIFEYILTTNKRFKDTFWDKPVGFAGYHVHHSTYGIAVLLLSLALFMINSSYSYFVLGIGVGIIVQHTITDKRLVFIEKVK